MVFFGEDCENVVRIDSDIFYDDNGDIWMSYNWFLENPPQTQWSIDNSGSHVSIVKLDTAFVVQCDLNVPVVHAANPHDQETMDTWASYCDRCDEMLDNFKNKVGEEMTDRDGNPWGVLEGSNLFRRGDYVYMMMSGSAWNSAYYDVRWIAAPTVEGLAVDNPDRLEGRYIIPSNDQAFGHGVAVKGPRDDGEEWYFVYHHLNNYECRNDVGDGCLREVWTNEIEFEDKGDGLGDVWIKPIFPGDVNGNEVIVLT